MPLEVHDFKIYAGLFCFMILILSRVMNAAGVDLLKLYHLYVSTITPKAVVITSVFQCRVINYN